MKTILYLIVLMCFTFSVLTSCHSTNKYDEIVSTIMEMGRYKTILPTSEMKCWKGDSSSGNYSDSIEGNKLKLVVYVDTTDCSICFLNHMNLWNDFLPLEQKYNGAIRFIFIIEARQNEYIDLYNQLSYTGLNHPIYIDEKLAFRKLNPHIPTETIYHTFVLDENNNIVLVGDPLRNEEIEKLLYKLIEVKCSRL